MNPVPLLLLFIALVGHLAIWCSIFNQVHATRWPRRARKFAEKVIYLCVSMIAAFLIAGTLTESLNKFGNTATSNYKWLCVIVAFGMLARFLYRSYTELKIEELISHRKQLHDIGAEMKSPGYQGFQGKCLGLIPGNQSLKLSIEHRVFQLKRWPKELDGLVIAHLSDLHFTGKISREYFEKVVAECNECNPDVVVITGDIVDSVECLDWLSTTLGKLTSRFGKYYILGNHDLRVRDETRLRKAIAECGFIYANHEWQAINVRGHSFFVAGNELPWFPGGELMTEPPDGPSIVLSHSPDQIYRISKLPVDLVLAGHCHGGQIRLPLLGPVVAPSRYGIRFASGTFKENETVMHVSRGISGDDPIRWNCPPELSIIKINAGS